jgi:hypothetical protein
MDVAPLYRVIHGSPLLLGLPPRMALTLLAGSVLLGLVGTVWNWMIGAGVAAMAAVFWGGAAWVFNRDRAEVAQVLLKLRGIRLSRKLSSFRPSGRRVVIVDRRRNGAGAGASQADSPASGQLGPSKLRREEGVSTKRKTATVRPTEQGRPR